MNSGLKESLTSDEVAYQRIRSGIIGGYFKAGERLREQELGDKLGISRTPVREALRRLEREGFLRKDPYKGVMVRKFTYQEAQNIYQVRAVLEGLGAYLLAEKSSPEILEKLKQTFALAGQALNDEDLGRVAQLNNDFHAIIATGHYNTMLAEMLLNLHGCISVLRVSTWTIPRRPLNTHHEHQAIIDAIERRKPEEARATATLHIQKSWEVASTVIKQQDVDL
ncbi:MAG: GntR family transcriptional regulator [Desulfitobacteriaceae bacterium]